MRIKKKVLANSIVSLLLVPFLCGALGAADPAVVVPMNIHGYIGYIHGFDGPYLEMMLVITMGAARVSDLDVRLNGQPAREISGVSYNYECTISSVRPDPAQGVVLTIAKKSRLGSRSTPIITAKGKITSLLRLTSPRDGQTFSPHDRGVTVAYEGGASPYHFSIYRIEGSERVTIPGGCPALGCFVPMTVFAPGSQYSFNLFAPIGRITFSGHVHPASSVVLRQHISHRITIGAVRSDG